MRILLLVSAFNGLTQRVWCHLKDAGHDVGVELVPAYDDPGDLIRAVEEAAPDLILCPFLKHRVPEEVWSHWDTVIVHPGPVGDRGPSSLDHAILAGRERWGVTALSAVEELDAGPVWATSCFDMPEEPIAKSALYNSRVADAALECVAEVVRMVSVGESPRPADKWEHEVPGTAPMPLLRRTAFRIDWDQSARELARRIAAADGAPGAPAVIDGTTYCLYDAVATSEESGAAPGTVVGHDTDAVAIACGRGTLWVGYAAVLGERRGPKLPAVRVIAERGTHFRTLPPEHAEASYERDGDVGYLTIRSYNGAMHTEQCRRLTVALEKALVEDTRVLVVRGTEHAFSNGIHLGVIDEAEHPAAEAWENIQAIDELCSVLVSAEQVTIAAFTANAGAGGVMLGLCADITVAREGVVLNPHYDMGIAGSELHTWRLPAKVGESRAGDLLAAKLPVSARSADRMGLVAEVGPRDWEEFGLWLHELAELYTGPTSFEAMLAERAARPVPPSYYQTLELAEMARDLFENRHGFAAKRQAFVAKERPTETPARLRLRRR